MSKGFCVEWPELLAIYERVQTLDIQCLGPLSFVLVASFTSTFIVIMAPNKLSLLHPHKRDRHLEKNLPKISNHHHTQPSQRPLLWESELTSSKAFELVRFTHLLP